MPLDESLNLDVSRGDEVIALDEALKELAELDPRQAGLVELRYYVGLTVEETARVLEISPATVKREWKSAKLWLRRSIGSSLARGLDHSPAPRIGESSQEG